MRRERKHHLVRWEEVKKSVGEGGLGLRSIIDMNNPLHGKWLWRFITQKDRLWRRVIEARWGDWEKERGRRERFKPHGKSLDTIWKQRRIHLK